MSESAGSSSNPQQASLIEDYVDIWFSPSAVFARRREGGAWGPLILTTLILCVMFWAAMSAMQGIFDVETAKAMAKMQAENPSIPADQLEQIRKVTEVSMRWGGLIFMPILLVVLGTCTWIVSKVLGGALSFGGGVMIASFAYLPKALDLLLFFAQSYVFEPAAGRYQYSIGVGRFLDPAMDPRMYNFLGRFDLFTIWVTVLLTLGLIHTAKVERPKAIVGGVILFVLGAIPPLLQR